MSWQEDLAEAIRADDLELAQIALDEGASPDGLDEDGRTPLYWAQSIEALSWLLRAGAHVAAERPRDGETSLHVAARRGTEFLQLLLDADGKCALETFNDRGMTPLICAVEAGNPDGVRLLLETGADIEAHHDPSGGDTPILWAVRAKDGEMVRLLLQAGADPNFRGERNLSANDRAAEWKDSTRHPELRAIHESIGRATGDPMRGRRRR